MPHKIVDHTADLGLMLWGESLSELFESAVSGFCELLVDPSTVTKNEKISFCLGKPTLESLLVGFLNELIYRFETDGFISKSARVKILWSNLKDGDSPYHDESDDALWQTESKDTGFECKPINSENLSQKRNILWQLECEIVENNSDSAEAVNKNHIRNSSWQLECEVFGEKANPNKHQFLHCIKAATYGGLKFEKNKDGWRVVVILDD